MRVSNERACLGLHFEQYKTSQIVHTAEKEIFEVGLRNLECGNRKNVEKCYFVVFLKSAPRAPGTFP